SRRHLGRSPRSVAVDVLDLVEHRGAGVWRLRDLDQTSEADPLALRRGGRDGAHLTAARALRRRAHDATSAATYTHAWDRSSLSGAHDASWPSRSRYETSERAKIGRA